MRIRLKVQPDGSLVDRSGANCGKISSLTLDIDLDSLAVLGAHGVGRVSDLASAEGRSSGTQDLDGKRSDERHQAVDAGSTNAVVAREDRLDGTDNRRALIEEYARIFDKPRTTISPGRLRAAERAFKEEPDFATLVRALEGAKRHYAGKGGRAPDFTDIFGTFRGTGDLASRINWFAGKAPDSDDAFADVPSGGREMVFAHRRQVEAMLKNPGDETVRSRGENSARFLAEMGFEATVADGRVRWQRK